MKPKIALTNCILYAPYAILKEHALLISDGQIVEIIAENQVPRDYTKVDLHGAYVCPGLVDLQIYGTGAHLFSAELTIDSIRTIENELLRQGCTSFCLTLATNTLSLFKEAIQVFNQANPRVALGLHLEGPFLNAKKRGAHPAELVIPAKKALLEKLLDSDEGAVNIMTVAPELFPDECLEYLLSKNILISAGHSDATQDEATQAFEKGIKTVTHLWNAMSPLHHREVGLPGATFNHPSVMASIIADGIHLSYDMLKLSKKALGERLFLITDAVASCSTGIYHHELNNDHYVLPDGTLSGSALTLLQAVKNCVQYADIALDEAIRMATLYPSNLINRKDLGRLEAGAKANILIFDSNFDVVDVYFEGQSIN